MTFVGKSFVVHKMQLQLSTTKNPDFKCHVNNQYEECFCVSGEMLNKK
jgi:hypothetical protein